MSGSLATAMTLSRSITDMRALARAVEVRGFFAPPGGRGGASPKMSAGTGAPIATCCALISGRRRVARGAGAPVVADDRCRPVQRGQTQAYGHVLDSAGLGVDARCPVGGDGCRAQVRLIAKSRPSHHVVEGYADAGLELRIGTTSAGGQGDVAVGEIAVA